MDIILLYDGDVITFAGDSVIVAFYPTPSEREFADSAIGAATVRCVRCASDLIVNCGTVVRIDIFPMRLI